MVGVGGNKPSFHSFPLFSPTNSEGLRLPFVALNLLSDNLCKHYLAQADDSTRAIHSKKIEFAGLSFFSLLSHRLLVFGWLGHKTVNLDSHRS